MRRSLRRAVAFVAAAALTLPPIQPVFAGPPSVLPQGGSVAAGRAAIGAPANHSLTINQGSQNAVINWNSFSIGQPNTVTFHQPNAAAATLNRVTGSTPSSIAGRLSANGQLYLINPNGIAITKTGTVNVGGGFVGSTLGIDDSDFLSGKRAFKGNGHSAAVSNAGKINAGKGGFVGLLGGTVSNSGLIRVPLGKVGLGSGESITLDVHGDGFMQVAVPTASKAANGKELVDVSGRIGAAGGSIDLEAATVKQAVHDAVNVSGTLSARSLSGHSGSIVLGGGPGGNVSVSGRLDVSAGRSAAGAASGRSMSAARNLAGAGKAAVAARKVPAPANGGTIAITGANVGIADKASLKATSARAKGGAISVTGNAVTIGSAALDASGATGGGSVLIGGGPQGSGPLAHAKTLSIASGATLAANATVNGNGGQIVAWSDDSTTVASSLSAQGAGAAGNGGAIETSGHKLDVTGISVNASAPHGAAGVWLLDPYNLTVSATATTATQAPNGTWTSNAAGSVVLNTDINTALNAGTTVVLQSSGTLGTGLGDVDVNAPISWNTNTTLTLTALNSVNINANITATGSSAGLVINPNTAIGGAPASGTGAFNLGLASITLSGASPNLSIGGFGYTVINSLGTAADAVTAPIQPTLQGVAASNLSGHYALGSDITADATSGWNAATGFTPIGTVALPFNGTFDGLGHIVSNLTIDRPAAADIGLFGSTGLGSVIQNVGLVGGSVNAASSAGGLVGSNTGTITNSYNTGSVGAGSSLGGLMGSNTGTVNNSYATGNVSGTSSLGGLMGSNTGAVSNSYAAGSVTGTSSLGGLMGSSTGPVTNSYATGSVTGTSSVGGLMGSSTGPVSDSYSTGSVSGTTSVGGLMGSSTNTVTNSYWNTQTSGQPTSPGGTGLTSAQMQQQANFNTWDFANTWIIYNGFTDPLLRSFMAPLTVTANNVIKTYDGLAFSGGNGVSYSVPPTGAVLGTVAYSGSSQGGINAGNYGLVPGGLYSDQQGYTITYAGGSLTVAAAPATVTGTKVYSGTTDFVVGQLSVAGGVNGETLSLTAGTATAASANVGSASAALAGLALSVAGGNALASNYLLPSTGILTVTPAAAAVAADPQSRAYGAANPTLTYVATGLVNGDTLTGVLATTAAATSNVGLYAITQGTLAASANYALSYTGANLTVTAAALSVGADPQSRAYGAANPTLTYVATGLVNGDMLTGLLATSATATSNVGAYGITQGTLAASANYALSYTGANLTVTAAALSVVADAQSRAYGAANPTLTYVATGLVNGDMLTGLLATTAGGTSNVGSYAITQGTLAASANYALTYTGANLTVTAAALSVAADSQSRAYGAANPTLTYVATGLVNGDALTGVLATTATVTSSVAGSPYAITQGTLAASANYALTYTGNNLTVTAAALSVVADPQSRAYGAANPTLTYVATGLVNGDTLTGVLATTAAATSNVGLYAITQGTLAASANYALTYTGANLTVTAGAATVTADAQLRGYGVANPTLTYVVTGLVNGEPLTGALATTATSTSNVGNYAIAQGTLANPFYTITYIEANLTVTAAALSVVADAQSRAYGAANPTLTYVATGLVNGDALTGLLATTAGGTSNVGSYAITQGTLAASANYALTYTGANLTVTAAALSVVADAQSRAYGAANPTLTYVATGLVNGDAFTGVLATTATVTSSVAGSPYAITQGTLAASANYALTYTGANLTVTAAPTLPNPDMIAEFAVFPSYFSTIGMSNHTVPSADVPTGSGSFACSPAEVSRRLHLYGRVELTGGGAGSCESSSVSN
jgi:filamentous hemagglutinin family protein